MCIITVWKLESEGGRDQLVFPTLAIVVLSI